MPIINKLSLVISVGLVLLTLIYGLSIDLTPFSFIYILLINLLCIYHCRRNIYMIIVTSVMFYSNYSIIFANYIGDIDSVYVHQYSKEIECISLNILLLFNALFSILILKYECISSIEISGIIKDKNKNSLIVFTIAAVLVYVFLFGYEAPDYVGGRGHPKPIYEYSVLLFILMYYYTGNNKLLITISGLFVIAFALQEFILGGRIMALQFLLVAYTMYYIKKIPVKYFVIFGMFMLVFMTFIGDVRGAMLSANFDLSSILSSFMKEGLALDTAYSAYNTSETFVVASQHISESMILEYIKIWLLSFFIGESANPEMTLGYISQQYGFHSFGGIYPFYFYFYFGGLGILGSMVLIYPYVKHCLNVSNRSSNISNLICVFFVCHAFRWYLYNPLGLVRSLMFFVVLYYLFDWYNKLSKSKL